MSGLVISILVVAALSALGAGGPALSRGCARACRAATRHAPAFMRAAFARRQAARETDQASRAPAPHSVERVLSLAELRRGG